MDFLARVTTALLSRDLRQFLLRQVKDLGVLNRFSETHVRDNFDDLRNR